MTARSSTKLFSLSLATLPSMRLFFSLPTLFAVFALNWAILVPVIAQTGEAGNAAAVGNELAESDDAKKSVGEKISPPALEVDVLNGEVKESGSASSVTASSSESVAKRESPSNGDAKTNSKYVDFERDVAPILREHCLKCHQGERAKEGFQITDRDALLGFVEPGDLANSALWTDYLNGSSVAEDPKSLVMPPSGPLVGSQIIVLKNWIEEGAIWPPSVQLVADAPKYQDDKPAEKSDTQLSRIVGAIGYFHPAVVHFPIALLLFGAGAAMLSFVVGSRPQLIAFHCLLWGTLFAIVAACMGWFFAIEQGYPAWNVIPTSESSEELQTLYRHRWTGIFVCVLSIIVVFLALLSRRYPSSSLRHVWRWGLIVVAVIVGIAGHQGGELIYGDLAAKATARLTGK